MSKYTLDFEEFWRRFPKRWNRDAGIWIKRKKRPAFKVWIKLPEEIRKECLSKVHLIKKAEGSASGIRDCVTWINQEGWDDIDLSSKSSVLPKEMTANTLKTVDKVPVFNDNNELERESIRKDTETRDKVLSTQIKSQT